MAKSPTSEPIMLDLTGDAPVLRNLELRNHSRTLSGLHNNYTALIDRRDVFEQQIQPAVDAAREALATDQRGEMAGTPDGAAPRPDTVHTEALMTKERLAEIENPPELRIINAQIALAEEAQARHLAVSEPLARLARRCDDWLPTRFTAAPFLVTPDRALFARPLDVLRARLVELDMEERDIGNTPRPLAEGRTRVSDAVRNPRLFPLNLASCLLPEAGEPRLVSIPALYSGPITPGDVATIVWNVLAYVFPAEVEAKAQEVAASCYRDNAALGLSSTDRVARLAAIEAERRSVEYAEELIIRRSAPTIAGQITRRGDARPEFVLAANVTE